MKLLSPQQPSAQPEAADSAPAADEVAVVDRRRFRPLAVRIGLIALIVCLASGTGFFTWQNISSSRNRDAAEQSVRAASDATVALLTYKPETVEQELEAARGRLTGQFLDSYTSLTRDVIIPGAQEKKIAATATIPAAATVSASGDHAVVLLFVNQAVSVGADAPTNSASSVRVSLDRIDDRWLVSGFDPI